MDQFIEGFGGHAGGQPGVAPSDPRIVDAKQKCADLEARLNRFQLCNLALFELISEKIGLSAEEVTKRMDEIDLRDGMLDGRVILAPLECPNCKKVIHRRQGRCMYCGFVAAGGPDLAARLA